MPSSPPSSSPPFAVALVSSPFAWAAWACAARGLPDRTPETWLSEPLHPCHAAFHPYGEVATPARVPCDHEPADLRTEPGTRRPYPPTYAGGRLSFEGPRQGHLHAPAARWRAGLVTRWRPPILTLHRPRTAPRLQGRGSGPRLGVDARLVRARTLRINSGPLGSTRVPSGQLGSPRVNSGPLGSPWINSGPDRSRRRRSDRAPSIGPARGSGPRPIPRAPMRAPAPAGAQTTDHWTARRLTEKQDD